MRLTEDQVRDALRDCYDPEIPVNIVELGIVERVVVEEDREAPGATIPGVAPRFRATVAIAPIPRESEATTILIDRIKNRLAGMEAISGAVVFAVETPAWTPQRITAQGYARLEALRLQKNEALGGNNLIQIELP